ncbi:4Fe-4S single cluster domain-containing protein [Gordonia sp. NPDC062954]|uniref:4Fe-4S single cluster domain-containing protein n=1 Tax=Gordonia sp. NPDC062954 TaxID=3364003 RepID=UPI0037C6EBD7
MDIPIGMTIGINRIAVSVRSLGPGRRVSIWVQGCTLGCRGCASTDTWDGDNGTPLPVTDLADTVAGLLTDHDGITITGGEPFQQGAAVAELLGHLDNRGALEDRDVLVFTGYAAPRAQRLCPELWERADAIVAGPYLPDRAGEAWLRASDNQELHVKSALAEERFRNGDRRVIQVATPGRDLAIAGLPRAGDLDEFRRRLVSRGIALQGGVSWLE